jgi:hypothetical protein
MGDGWFAKVEIVEDWLTIEGRMESLLDLD